MKYQSQKVAYAYFLVAMGLFGIQVLGGLLAGWVYVWPNTLSELLPFNIIRMIHTNALIVWLLLGFFGAAYFLVPEESEREIWSVKLAYLQLIILVVGTLGAVGSYLMGIHGGREFLEQPLWVKCGILVAAVIFLINISMTVLAGRKTAITGVLLTGLWLLSLLWIFAFINPDNLSLDKMYWWFVVHLWVEGTWELVMAAILAFLMLKLTGVDREVVEKWLYVIVATALFSGILGTGHHFYWIGLPGYWQWTGSIFSAFEVVPFFAMMSFAFIMVWKGRRNHPNKAALLWALGVLRGGRLGLPAHLPRRELLHPRHPDHRGARPPCLLRCLCGDEPCDHHLRHAAAAGPCALQSGAEHGLVLADDRRHGVHDLCPHLCRHDPDPYAAHRRRLLHGCAGPAGPVLHDAPWRGRLRGAGGAAVHPQPGGRAA